MRMSLVRLTAAAVLGGLSVTLISCESLPGRTADERWADYRNWTKVTEGKVGTGDPTGYIGNVHRGPDGYRDVYVNDIGAAMLAGEGPYNFPAGTVIVKEQYKNQAAWESGKPGDVTVSVKTTSGDTVSKDNWIWAESYKSKAGESQFCSGCHSIAAKDDFAFTNGTFLATQ